MTGSTSAAPATVKLGSTKIEIRLDESNYVFWEFAMTDMLRDNGLLQYVLSRDELEAEGLSPIDLKQEPDHVKNKAKAASAISKNLGQEQIALILQHRGDPAAAWKALRDEYAGSSNQDVATMIMEINKLRLTEQPTEEEAKAHFAKMTLLANKLRAVGDEHKIAPNALATTLLLSLPDEFEPVKYARLSGPTKGLTPQAVRNDVIACIKRRVAEAGTRVDQPAAMTTTGGRQRTGKKSSQRAQFRGKCWNCQKVGHRSADCRQRQGGNAGSGMIALLTCLAGTSQGPRNGSRDFVVDGAASCGHISARKNHFGDSYRPVNGTKPSIGGIGADAERVLIHGYGNVKLKKPADGSLIELKDVAYVPSASANLFSVNAALSQLEKTGDKDAEYKEKARSGKLTSGSGKVILTCSKRGGLKYLDLHSEQDF
jgi:hypothetical protein